MNLHLLRISSAEESTLGWFYIDHEAECMTLEDQYQKVKVKKETRIPDGRYEVKFREDITPMTKRYRKQFPWFTYHLQVQDVRGFENVYIHKGNTDDHTEGCILLGDSLINNQYDVGAIKSGKGFLGNSTQAFERVYKKVFSALKAGDEVTLDIHTYNV